MIEPSGARILLDFARIIRYILRDLHKRTTAFFHNHGAS
jgi:hypothetical protein